MRVDKATSVFVCVVALLSSATPTSGSEGAAPVQEGDQHAAENTVFGLESDMMCGPNCLWQIAYAYGEDYSLRDLKDMAATDMVKGTTVAGMCDALRQMGLQAQAVKGGTVDGLCRDSRIAVLLVDLGGSGHYVILDSIEGNMVRLLDGDKFVNMTVARLRSIWKGYVILVGDSNAYAQHARLFRYTGVTLQVLSVLVLLAAAAVYCGGRVFRRRRPGETGGDASQRDFRDGVLRSSPS